MKRLRILVALALAVPMGAAQANESDAGAGAFVVQMAEADWMIRHGNRATLYFAVGLRGMETPEAPVNLGIVGKGTCEVEQTKRFTMIVCFGRGRAYEISAEQFTLHPALDSAHLEFEARGFAHIVDWTGNGSAPQVGQALGISEDGVGVAAGADRDARATGTVFGKSLEPQRFSMSYLAQGLAAGASLGMFEGMRPGDTVRIARTFKIPRRPARS